MDIVGIAVKPARKPTRAICAGWGALTVVIQPSLWMASTILGEKPHGHERYGMSVACT
jgi:hypothetical protein